MQRKSVIALVLALVIAAGFAGRAFASPVSCDPRAETATVSASGIGDFLAELAGAPAVETKASCPAPYCVTNHDCIIRPVGDANSTCEYGRIPPPPPGCGHCYY